MVQSALLSHWRGTQKQLLSAVSHFISNLLRLINSVSGYNPIHNVGWGDIASSLSTSQYDNIHTFDLFLIKDLHSVTAPEKRSTKVCG